MSGVFFSRHSVDSATTENAKWLVSEITAGMAIIGLKIVRIKAKWKIIIMFYYGLYESRVRYLGKINREMTKFGETIIFEVSF